MRFGHGVFLEWKIPILNYITVKDYLIITDRNINTPNYHHNLDYVYIFIIICAQIT